MLLQRSILILFWVVCLNCHTLVLSYSSQKSEALKASRFIKAKGKIVRFSQQNNNKHNPTTLVVDGNNVRGIAQFRWDPIELQHCVEVFCQEYGISQWILVWDHGSCKFAAPINSRGVVVFSGLSQRADDVIAKESSHIATKDMLGGKNDWSSLAFVTSDGGLMARLRQKFATVRRQCLTGSKDDVLMPLMMDSASFAELLSSVDDSLLKFDYNNDLSVAVQRAQDSICQFKKLQKLGSNSQREKTWERCVIAVTMEWALLQRPLSFYQEESFATKYVQDLESRGWFSTSKNLGRSNDDNIIFPGPSRLEKVQKRLLLRYNRAQN